MGLLSVLDAQQVAIYETFVVPRFVSMFGALALEMVIPCDGAVVANVGCRTGFPDQLAGRYLPGGTLVGFDPSEAALALARTKGALVSDITLDYRYADDLPLPVSDGSFSHVMALYPVIEPARRSELLVELARLLAPGGQLLLSLPLRGSYQEVADLLREFALKHDAGEVAKALESHITSRPTLEGISEELESAGLDDIDVEVRLMTLSFRSGRDFLEDPITRVMLVPDLELSLGLNDIVTPMSYVREAIDRYWSEGDFELSVNIGCASARKF